MTISRTLGLNLAAALALQAGASAAAVDEQALAARAEAQFRAFAAAAQPNDAARSAGIPKAAPVINAVSVTTPSLNVSAAPRVAKIRLDISGGAGLKDVWIDTRSRDYGQQRIRGITMPYPRTSGVFYFNTPDFSTLQQTGSWDIRFVGACDVNGACATLNYFGQPPAAERTFAVSHSRTPDTSQPTFNTGAILTQSITTTSAGANLVKVRLGVADTGTGVASLTVCAQPRSGATEICGEHELPAVQTNGTEIVTIPFPGNTWEEGLWDISVVHAIDRSGTDLLINDPPTITTLFGGDRSFRITNGS